MSQTYQSRTPNHSNHKTGTLIPLHHDLVLTGAQARALWEYCTLTAYSVDGFTVTSEMERVAKLVVDQGGSASDRAFCLARADQRERALIAAPARRVAA
jgi:hypothetical protein